MSNTFKKTSFRGFTLIELLVVIAIIGLLSTIIAAPIQSARKKARDAKKISELKSLELAIEQYGESNNSNYPKNLTALSPAYMPLLPTFAASTTSSARDAYAYVTYDAMASGAPTTTFAYHLGSKLEVYGPALDTDRDCIGGSLSNQLIDPFCVVYNGNSLTANMLINGTTIVASTTGTLGNAWGIGLVGVSGTDFDGSPENSWPDHTPAGRTEQSSSTCLAMTDCVFDITAQQ